KPRRAARKDWSIHFQKSSACKREDGRVRSRFSSQWLPAILGVALSAGCARDYPESLHYPFRPHPVKNAQNEKVYVGDKLSADERRSINENLEALFGTPRHPYVDMEVGLQKELLFSDALLAKDAERPVEDVLEEGSRLYRQHCLYCHGLTGDASGPTGQFLNP